MTSLTRPLARTALLSCALLLALSACDGENGTDAGTDAAALDGGPMVDARVFPDGAVFCETDEDCNDGQECTEDSCGGNGTCFFRGNSDMCQDGVFCNGSEICVPYDGCISGSRVTCNDEDVCTVDRCNEDTMSCTNVPRDLDEDGDVDWFCAGGGDCDDTDPLISSMVSEVCDDLVDNDCDEMVDESDCGAPRFDTCDDPLDVSAGGVFVLDTGGSASNYSLSCRTSTLYDMVATFTLTEARSVTIEAEGEFFSVAASLRTDCTDGGSEVACESGFPGVIRRRSLPAGTYFVIVASSSAGEITLDVDFDAPLDPATNDTCSSPIDVSAGGVMMGSFVEVANDYATSCEVGSAPDLAYVFTTTSTQDVQITTTSMSGSSMSYSVRTACADDASQIRCAYGNPATGILHELPAGTYYILVEGPSFLDDDFTLDVTFSAPTPAPAGDTCGNAIALTSGTPAIGTLVDKENDVEVTCGFRYRDAVYSFTLTEDSDVSLDFDTGSFSNLSLRSTCGSSASELSCSSGNPVATCERGLAAGTYYVIAESRTASGFSLSYEATPAQPITTVSGNDTCAAPHVIPATGGLFSGSTTGFASNWSSASCGSGAGSPDAVFQLDLSATKRVLLSTRCSEFDTVLHIHNGTCGGSDVHCNDDRDTTTDTSYLDRTLTAGTWYIVVDGFGTSSSGDYDLEVTISDP